MGLHLTGSSLTQLDNAYGAQARGSSGVGLADGTDQSTVLQAVADAYETLGGGRIPLPSGTIVGHVTLAAGVTVEGKGKDATILQRPAGWDGPVVASKNFATLQASGGTGTTHDMGCRDLTIDGKRGAGGFTVPLPGTVPTTPTASTSTTGGTLAAGSQRYRVAPITAAGVGIASNTVTQVTTGSTSTVTVSWSAITGATGYVIYGRISNGNRMIQVGAVTSWTDDGSLTPITATPFRWAANLTAPAAVALYGWRPVMSNVRIINAPGPGLHSSWRSPTGVPGSGLSMEATMRDVTIENSGTNNLVWDGPHDSMFHNFVGARPGQASQVAISDTDNVVTEAGGPIRFVTSHVWGQSRRGFGIYGASADLTACQSEGALDAQVYVQGPSTHINGIEMFAPGGASARGIAFGDSRSNAAGTGNVHVRGLRAYGFSSSSGAAVDLTLLGPYGTVEGSIDQTTGTPITGTASADSLVNLRVNGMVGAQFQVPGFSVPVASTDVPTPAALYDHFTATDATALDSTKWTVTTGGGAGAAVSVNGNRAKFVTDAAGGYSNTPRVRAASTLSTALKDAEVLFKYEHASVSVESYLFAAIRASLTDFNNGSRSAYFIQVSQNANGTWRWLLIARVAGSNTTLLDSGLQAAASVGDKRWFRFRVSGTTVKARMWADGTAEPSVWTYTGTDSTVTGAGSVVLEAGAGAAAVVTTQLVDQVAIYTL